MVNTDLASQILPVASVLAGVGMTFLGTTMIERSKWRRSRADAREDRSRLALTELLQSVTEIAAALKQTADQIALGASVEAAERSRTTNAIATLARRQATAAYLGCTEHLFDHVRKVEDALRPVYRYLEQGIMLREPEGILTAADELITARNNLINQLRRVDGLQPLEDDGASARRRWDWTT